MRRFSQRNALVTLNEINITPLLDLAFVLLIIFVITTPLLDNGLPLKLSKGGNPDQKIEKNDIRTVDITADGIYNIDKHPLSLNQLEATLKRDHQANPNLVVYIRADEMARVDHLYAVIDRCQRNGITKYSLRTDSNK